jgi:hypothetical protein
MMRAALALLLTTVAVQAHEAQPTAAMPQGWTYPFACCASYDCRQAGKGEVTERPDGYHTPNDVISYGDKRVRPSPDGEFHWCAHQSGLDAGKTICLFVPDRGT